MEPPPKRIAIAKKYGLITVGEAHVYMVKGSGKIVECQRRDQPGNGGSDPGWL